MSDDSIRGRFLWYDLMTTDTEAAQKFYPKVTAWGIEIWSGAGSPYPMWKAGETPIGGAGVLPEEARSKGMPPYWLAHVGTSNVDAACRQVEELQGRVLKQPEDIPTVGRFAVIADPHGAVLSLFQPQAAPPGHQGDLVPGQVSWHELLAGNLDEAWTFYQALFGWAKMDVVDMGEMGPYQMFGVAGRMLGGIFTKPDTIPGPPNWLYYVLVSDLGRALEAVRAGGGQVMNGPMEVPGGDHVAQCLDPQGAAFALHEKKAR